MYIQVYIHMYKTTYIYIHILCSLNSGTSEMLGPSSNLTLASFCICASGMNWDSRVLVRIKPIVEQENLLKKSYL